MTDWQGYQKINEKYHLNGATIIVNPTEILSSWQNGAADFSMKRPFTLQTTSGLGSLSKQFTADSVLLLNAADKLDIEASLVDYVPNYRYADQVTLRQMLNMASGIPDYTELLLTDYAKRMPGASESHLSYPILEDLGHGDEITEVISLLNQHPLDFTPGEKGVYSNSNYLLLGFIISKITGDSLARFFEEHFFEPLAMTQTRLGTQYAEANSYDDLDVTAGKPVVLGRGAYQGGDGAVVSSLTDLAKWAQAVLRHDILSEKDWHEALTLTHDFYGMGWMHSKTPNWFSHAGHVFGYWTYFDVSFDKQLAQVTLDNMSPGDEARKTWQTEMAAWRETL